MAYEFEVSTLSQLSGAPNPSRGDPLCFSPSCLWPHASPCISSSPLDRCGHFFFFLLLLDSCLVPFLFYVDLQLSVTSPSPLIWNLPLPLLPTPNPPTPPPSWLVRLSVAPSSSCVDLHSDWLARLSLVLDLTMWPRLLWHHMVPSSARDRWAHTHLPLPASHTSWDRNRFKGKVMHFYFYFVCLICV